MDHIKYIFFILLILLVLPAQGSHNRAGEITFKHLSGNTYEVTLNTYIDYTGNAERPFLKIFWGDGTSNNVKRHRINRGIGDDNIHPVQKNVYIDTHTYPGPGTYTIRMRDQYLVPNIVNMVNSGQTAFYVETRLKIFSEGDQNSSPVLLQLPIDFAQIGQVYVHYPNAYDKEGDSLAYSLVTPKRSIDQKVNGYYKPNAKSNFSIDPVTGRLEWDYPDSVGIFNIAISIKEYRHGKKIGEVVRNMQIIVSDGNNKRPQLSQFKDTCVEAGTGTNLKIPVKAADTNPDQSFLPHEITLSATGGPFTVDNNKASFNEVTSQNRVSNQFSWKINCSHIKRYPYRVVFKAKDDHPDVPLADLRHMDIKVVGPEPEDLTSNPRSKGVQLNWKLPNCTESLVGFRVYRRVDTSNWEPSYCENGIPANTKFEEVQTIMDKEQTSYFDQEVAPGAIYCYRITGLFRNEGDHNLTEGYASNETCLRIKKDVPVIIHVDVRETSKDSGVIFLDWSKPVEIDSKTYKPPYKYEIYRSKGLDSNNSKLIKTVDNIQSYNSLVSQSADTLFYDSSLNTEETQYSYTILFYGHSNSQEVLAGSSRTNSSLHLNIQAGNHKLKLSWNASVLWQNQKYILFRQNPHTTFEPIDTVKTTTYTDQNINPDSAYCYYIKSIGAFTAPGYINPVINTSQVNCGEPIDTIAPCSPKLEAEPLCEKKENRLYWDKPFCPKDSNVASYKIYFRNDRSQPFKELKEIKSGQKTTFIDQRDTLSYSLAGCYAVTALDKYNNESKFSNFICVDNCPKYKLPNVFTPNGDGINDYFKPKPGWQFVKRVNLKVFNRWGDIVYETSKANFKWDGTDVESGKDLSPGTYYYEIKIFEMRLDGIQSKKQSGAIQLIR